MAGSRHHRLTETENQFFSLLRAGLWNEVPDASLFASGADWEGLYRLASEQTVVGHVTGGINRLGTECLPREPDRLDPFLGDLVATSRRNAKLDGFTAKLFDALEGVPAVLVKGQALAQDYLDPQVRQPGDIDILLPPQAYARAKEILLPKATKVMDEEPAILHQGMMFGSVEVELHGSISTLMSRRLDRRLSGMVEELFRQESLPSVMLAERAVPVPDALFNAVYIFVHFLHHYWSGGVGLRQLADWTMYLSVHKREIDPGQLRERLKNLGLERLWSAFTGFSVSYLGCPAEKLPLCGSLSPEKGRRIWNDIRRCGNFGKNISRSRGGESYWTRKVHSFWQLVVRDRLRHFPAFPAESLRFFLGATGYGLERLAKGE